MAPKASVEQSPHSSFVPAGSKAQHRRNQSEQGLLRQARDWGLLTDLPHAPLLFPPEICATSQRPDLVIWSTSKRLVIMIELTCPAEENISAAAFTKSERYADLQDLIQHSGWSSRLFTVEVGARGFVGHSARHCLRSLGMSNRDCSRLTKDLSEVAARCSYALWIARHNASWIPGKLLEPVGHEEVGLKQGTPS